MFDWPAVARSLGVARILAFARERRGQDVAREAFDASPLSETVPVCALSGQLPHAGCSTTIAERFVPGRVPTEPCTLHSEDGEVLLDARSAEWARGEGWLVGEAERADGPLRIEHPSDGAEWWVDPLRRTVTIEEVGDVGLYMLSDLSRSVTGETHHADSGSHVVGMKAVDAPDIDAVTGRNKEAAS